MYCVYYNGELIDYFDKFEDAANYAQYCREFYLDSNFKVIFKDIDVGKN